jgi:hypothetical protein
LGYRIGRKDKNNKPCTVKNLVPFAEMEQEFLHWFIPEAKDALLGKDNGETSTDVLEAKQKALRSRIETTFALMDKEDPMPVEQIKARLTRLETERRAVEAQLAEARAEASTKATHPDTIHELETLIDACDTGNQEARKKVAALVPSFVKEVVIDLTDRWFPSFAVHLTDPKAPVLEWRYDIVEFSREVKAFGANGTMLLGNPKILEGGYVGR